MTHASEDTFEQFIARADATRQPDQRWTIHFEGLGQPCKMYDCVGETAYEAMEDAWAYFERIRDELARKPC